MKFLVFLLSLNLLASQQTCQELLNEYNGDLTVADLQFLPKVEQVSVSYADSKLQSPEVVALIGEFDAQSCEGALKAYRYGIDGSSLTFVYTNEDRCDGGNAYGYLIDGNDQLVGLITDTYISCL